MRTLVVMLSCSGFLATAAAAQLPGDVEQETSDFFVGPMWLLVALPFAVFILVAWSQRKPRQTVREYSAENFESAVLMSEQPTLVHFYRSWSIGDQVMIAQVERIARNAAGVFNVGFIDVDKNEAVLSRWSQVTPPALLLFCDGKKIFHCEGVFDEADVVAEVRDLLVSRPKT